MVAVCGFQKKAEEVAVLVETSVWMRPGQRIELEIPVTIAQEEVGMCFLILIF